MKQKPRSTLFLMEMIIAVCFFAVTAAICTQVFVKAHILTGRTSELNQAVLHAENAAEAFRSSDGDFESFALLFPEAEVYSKNELNPGARYHTASGYMAIFYDSNWNVCDETSAVYRLNVNATDEPDIRTAQISIIRSALDEVVYSLDVHKHPGREASYE